MVCYESNSTHPQLIAALVGELCKVAQQGLAWPEAERASEGSAPILRSHSSFRILDVNSGVDVGALEWCRTVVQGLKQMGG